MKEDNVANADPENCPSNQTAGSKGFDLAANIVTGVYLSEEGATKADVDGSACTVSPQHFATYDYCNDGLVNTESSIDCSVRQEIDPVPLVQQLYDGSFGIAGVEAETTLIYQQTAEGCLTPPVEQASSLQNATPYEELGDSVQYPYWYTSNTAMPTYSPIPLTSESYGKAMNTYPRYSYSNPLQYYPESKVNYNSSIPERKGRFCGAYSMQEAFYQGKINYPFMSPTRRPQTWVSMPPNSDLAPTAYYNMSPDAVSYKGWTASGVGGRDTSPQGNVTVPILVNEYPQEAVSMNGDPQYEADSFYHELSARLKTELKKKTSIGTAGRPKMNRNNYVCANCNAKSTPQWRYIKGSSVCNACYMRIRKQKMKRLKQEKEAMHAEAATETGAMGNKRSYGTLNISERDGNQQE